MAILESPAELIGDVTGPTGAVDNAIARFDGSSGKKLKNSNVYIDDNGRLGINTPQIPHAGIGGGLLQIYGTGGATTTAPGIQLSLETDYPAMQLMPYAHDNVRLDYDCYAEGNFDRSSDLGSNFSLRKSNDWLSVACASGIAVGASIGGSWKTNLRYEADGDTMMSPDQPYKTYWRNTSAWIASLGDTYLDLGASVGVRVTGTLSCPDPTAGEQSQRFGPLATAAHTRCTIIGYSADSTNNYATAIGYSAQSGFGCVAAGYGAVAGSYAVAIGYTATTGALRGIAIGYGAATVSQDQCVIGGDVGGYGSIVDFVVGRGVTHATPYGSILWHVTSGEGTDIAGSGLKIAGGQGTGTGAGGDIELQTAPAGGASGSSLNALVTRMTVQSDGKIFVKDSSTLQFDIDTITSASIYTVGTDTLSRNVFKSGSGNCIYSQTFQFHYFNGNGGSGTGWSDASARYGAVFLQHSAGNTYLALSYRTSGAQTGAGVHSIGLVDLNLGTNGASRVTITSTGNITFLDDLLISDAYYLYFRNTNTWIASLADTYLDLGATGGVRVSSPTTGGITWTDSGGTDKEIGIRGGAGGAVAIYSSATSQIRPLEFWVQSTRVMSISTGGTTYLQLHDPTRLLIRDAAIYIASLADTYMDIAADGAVRIWNTISCTKSLSGTESFGLDQTVGQTNSTYIGSNVTSSTTGHSNVVVGRGASAGSGADNVYGSTVIGTGASASTYTAVVVGYGAASTGTVSVAIGSGASCSIGDVVVGSGASAVSNGVALGYLASASGARGIAIGRNAVAAAGECQIGGDNANGYVASLCAGRGTASATTGTLTFRTTDGSGTDITGWTLNVAGGRGTGTGPGGEIQFQTAPAGGASGSGLNALITRMTITSTGKVGIGTGSVPYSNQGAALLQLYGTGSSVNGPHLQFTTTASIYPLMQIMPWTLSNSAIGFDTAWNGSAWTSSTPNGNFTIYNSAGALQLRASGGVAAGSPITWLYAMQVETDAEITNAPNTAQKSYWRNANAWIASLADTYLDLGGSVGVRVTGTLSCPGAGTNSERFGDSTTATGNSTVAIGQGASASYDNCVVVGQNSYTTSTAATIIGRNAHGGTSSVVVGNAGISGSFGIAVGQNSNANTNSVAIGASANASGNDSISIGFAASDGGYADCIVIARGGAATAANQLVIGNGDMSILNAYIGKGVVHATPADVTFQSTGGSGTDIAGADLTVAGGRGTGTGIGGDLIFSTAPPAGGSGSTLNALVARMKIYYDGKVEIGDLVGGNHSRFEADGTLVFVGNATVWKDINIAGENLTPPSAGAPTYGTYDTSSIEMPFFDGATLTQSLHGGTEMQHDYYEGTAITPHVHWTPDDATAGNVKWQLEYWIKLGSTTIASGTLTVTSAATGTAWDEIRADFPTISGTGLVIGAQILFRIFRDPTDAADTYTGDAGIFTFGFHHQVDTVGSRQIITK